MYHKNEENMFHTHTHTEAKQVIRVVYTKSNNKTLFIFKKNYYYDVQQFLFAIHFISYKFFLLISNITQNNILFNTSFGVKSCDEYHFLYFNTIIRFLLFDNNNDIFFSLFCMYVTFDKSLFCIKWASTK